MLTNLSDERGKNRAKSLIGTESPVETMKRAHDPFLSEVRDIITIEVFKVVGSNLVIDASQTRKPWVPRVSFSSFTKKLDDVVYAILQRPRGAS